MKVGKTGGGLWSWEEGSISDKENNGEATDREGDLVKAVGEKEHFIPPGKVESVLFLHAWVAYLEPLLLLWKTLKDVTMENKWEKSIGLSFLWFHTKCLSRLNTTSLVQEVGIFLVLPIYVYKMDFSSNFQYYFYRDFVYNVSYN